MVREGYKKTEVGEIPEDWEVIKLEECCIKITDGSHSSPTAVDFSEYKICTVANMMKTSLDLVNATHISKNDYEKLILNGCGAQLGDVLLSKDGTVGKTLLFDTDNKNIVFLSSIAIIRPSKWLIGRYLNQYLSSSMVLSKLVNVKTGSAIKRIVLRDIKALKIILPPLKEQEKIAEILSTLDCQIDDTDKLIEKTKELKKGLMQKLLTKGIGHTEFKKTEVGEIPVEWEVKKVSELVKSLKSGLSRSLKDENIGVPCLRSNNIKSDKLVLDDLKYWYNVDDKGANIEDYILEVGDIIINFINSVSQIGKGCIFDKENFRTIYTTNLLRVKVDDKKIINRFFNYYMQTSRYKKDISLITKPAVNQASFTTVEYKAIKFPVPKLTEQKRIVDILSSVDSEIEEYENKKSKLEHLKKGLMQQLLTGKIRVI